MKTQDDLGDSTKWSLGDVNEYGRVMKTVEQRVESLKEMCNAHRRTIRDVERTMLRGKLLIFARCSFRWLTALVANTRKEEITRFSKASTDAEFARILKARTLGPEHLETQSQLRRQIRVSTTYLIGYLT